MLHQCSIQVFKAFYIETSNVPSTKHQWFIDQALLNHQCNNDESPIKKELHLHVLRRNSRQQFCVFFRSQHFHWNWAKIFVLFCKELRGKRTNFQTPSENTLTAVLKSIDLQCFFNIAKLVNWWVQILLQPLQVICSACKIPFLLDKPDKRF